MIARNPNWFAVVKRMRCPLWNASSVVGETATKDAVLMAAPMREIVEQEAV